MPGFLDNLMTGYANKVLGAPTASPADTASAYQNLMNSMNQNYKQQKQNFETNPDNQGKQWTAPSTEQRWNDQVNAMITSGNPALQKRGLALLTAPKAAKDTRTDLQKQFEFLKGQGFQGTAGDLFNRIHPGRAVTNVNVSTGGEKAIPLTDLQRLATPDGRPLPFGTTPSQARQMGAKVVQSAAQTKTGTGADVLTSAMSNLKSNIDASSDNPVESVANTVRTQPGIIGAATNAALTAAGKPIDSSTVKFNAATRQIAGQVTNIMNGAGASEGERDYWASLQPQLTDDKKTRQIKFNQMVDFGQSMVDRAKAAGVQNLPNFNKVEKFSVKQGPAKFTSKSGIAFTVE